MDSDNRQEAGVENDKNTSKRDDAALSDADEKAATVCNPSVVPPVATTEKSVDNECSDIEAVRTADSNYTPPAVKVPSHLRRGLFGRFTLVAEVTEPKHYPRGTKWWITFVIASAALAAPLGSTIIFPSLNQIAEELNTRPTIANFSAAFYMLAMAIFPLWWSSFSETLGRRTIYLVSFALFLVWNVLSAVSVNIAMLVVMRILGGGAAASVQAVGAGTIADIWHVKERGKAMGMFYLGPLTGPLLAPIIGGALAEKLGWRSTQWFLVIYGGVVLLLLFLALPETLKVTTPLFPKSTPSASSPSPPESPASSTTSTSPPQPTPLSRTASRTSVAAQATKRWIKVLKRILIDPLSIILYLRFPAVCITVYYASIAFGSLYLLNISLETTFSAPPYRFSTIIVGLTYIPGSLGYILASLFGGRWTDRIMAREARRAGRYDTHGKPIYQPEDRMRENAWIAAVLYPAALVWYGWTAERGVVWPVPLLANFFFGVGSMLIFSMTTTMLTEFMPRRASAGVAVNNLVRNCCSCVGAVVARPLIDAIGDGWLFTGVGVIALASSVVVWAMRRFGPRWRVRMVEELG